MPPCSIMYSSSPSSSGRSTGEDGWKGNVATANAIRGKGRQAIVCDRHCNFVGDVWRTAEGFCSGRARPNDITAASGVQDGIEINFGLSQTCLSTLELASNLRERQIGNEDLISVAGEVPGTRLSAGGV